MLKTMWGETEGLILLSWSVLFVGGRVVRGRGRAVRWERWEVSEVGRWESSEVAGKAGKVGEW